MSADPKDHNKEQQRHHVEVTISKVPLCEEVRNIGLGGDQFAVVECDDCVIVAELSYI